MPIHAHIFGLAILTRNVGHTDLFFVCEQGSLIGLRMQDYKSLCAVVMICATLINIQTDTQTYSIVIRLYEHLSQLS